MSREVDDYYSVYRELFPRARKPHKCHACDEMIQPGSQYARVSIVFDGSAEDVVRCMRCQKIHEHLRDKTNDLWPDERLNCGEEYKQHWGEDPPAEIAALAFALPGEVLP